MRIHDGVVSSGSLHAQTRLISAFLLLRCPEVVKNIPNAAGLETEMDQLTPVFRFLGEIFPSLQELRRTTEALHAALEGFSDPSKNRVALTKARAEQLQLELRATLPDLKSRLANVHYPFDPSRPDMMLAEYARAGIPAVHKLQATYNDCASHINRLMSLYFRVLGRLAFIALKVEEAMAIAASE